MTLAPCPPRVIVSSTVPLADPTQIPGKGKGSWDIHSGLCFSFSPILGSGHAPSPLTTMGLLCVPFCPLLQDEYYVLI